MEVHKSSGEPQSEHPPRTPELLSTSLDTSFDRLTSFGNIYFGEEVRVHRECLGYLKRIVYKNLIVLHLWNEIVFMLCVIATLLDPLFCYMLVVNEEKNCIGFDQKLRVATVVLRSLVDLGYLQNLRFAYENIRRRSLHVAVRYFTLQLTFLQLFLCVQVIILFVIPATQASDFTAAIRSMKFVLVIQYFPRAFRAVTVTKKLQRSSRILPKCAGAKAIFNLFLYMLASHVFGSLWYLFSVERRATCLQERCHSHPYCAKSYSNSSVERFCIDACSAKASSDDTTGIFDDAFKSGIVYSTNFIGKLSYCYWKFAEISAGNVWNTIAGGDEKRWLEEKRLEGQAIELWMPYHALPLKLKSRIEKYQNFKCKETGCVDVGNILRNLPTDIRRDTIRHLCSDAIKSVPLLENKDEKFLDSVYDHLKHTLYIECSFIVREGEPLDEMIFIIRGRLLSYSNSEGNINGQTQSFLGKGDFFGEDLLEWVFRDPGSSTVPISTKTVRAHSKVEAFVLSGSDLRNVVSKFWWLFGKDRNDPDFKERREARAALVVQDAWRHCSKSKQLKKKRAQTETENPDPSVSVSVNWD